VPALLAAMVVLLPNAELRLPQSLVFYPEMPVAVSCLLVPDPNLVLVAVLVPDPVLALVAVSLLFVSLPVNRLASPLVARVRARRDPPMVAVPLPVAVHRLRLLL